MSSALHLDVLVAGDQATVGITGEIDISTAKDVREKLVSLISQGVRHLVIDLEGTKYMDAAGVDVLVRALKLVSALGGTFSVACPHEHLLKVFEVSELSDAFHVYSSLEEATTAPGRSRSGAAGGYDPGR
jgi:anti-sigma B factor antagonist